MIAPFSRPRTAPKKEAIIVRYSVNDVYTHALGTKRETLNPAVEVQEML